MKAETIKRDAERGIIYNVLPAGLVANMPDDLIKQANEATLFTDEMIMFEGMLYMLCFDYIKTKGLKHSDTEYKLLTNNLSKLTAFYDEDSGLQLTPKDIQDCIEDDIIPVSMAIEAAPGEPPAYITKDRFSDVIHLAWMIMENYQTPDDPDRPTQGNLDGFENLCYGAADYCASVYKMHKSFEEYMRKSQAERVTVEQHKADNSLDFDL